jgi:hypothetical protein
MLCSQSTSWHFSPINMPRLGVCVSYRFAAFCSCFNIDCSRQLLCDESHSFLCSVRQPRAVGSCSCRPRSRSTTPSSQGTRMSGCTESILAQKRKTRELRPALVRGRTPACKVEFTDEGLAVEHEVISARRSKIPLQADSIVRRGAAPRSQITAGWTVPFWCHFVSQFCAFHCDRVQPLALP